MSEHGFGRWRRYTCTTEMNSALIVMYFVAQTSKSTFTLKSFSVCAVKQKDFKTFIYAHATPRT